jgi:hypothetical protein
MLIIALGKRAWTGTEGNKDRGADRNGQGTMRIRSKTVRDRHKRGQGQRQSGNVVVRKGKRQPKIRDMYRAKRQRRTNGVRTEQKTGKKRIKQGYGQRQTLGKNRQG